MVVGESFSVSCTAGLGSQSGGGEGQDPLGKDLALEGEPRSSFELATRFAVQREIGPPTEGQFLNCV